MAAARRESLYDGEKKRMSILSHKEHPVFMHEQPLNVKYADEKFYDLPDPPPETARPKLQKKQRFSLRRQSLARIKIEPDGEDALKQNYVMPRGVQICDKKTEAHAMKVQLEEEKAKYENIYRDLQQQQEQVERDENEFKALIARHDETILTNLHKRELARAQALEESNSKTEQDAKLVQLQKEMEALEKHKEATLVEIEQLQKYHDFMLEVWRVSDGEFEDVPDIINRYNRFRDTYEDLENREAVNTEELAKMRSEFSQNHERRNTEIMKLTNQINSHEKEIENLQRESQAWEGKLSKMQIESANKNLLLSQIKMAVDNLFYIINKYIKIKRGGESTVEKLDKIQAFIFDLDEVVEEVPLMVSESDQLVSFFKEKAWYQYGGASQDIDVDYINPNPQEDKSVTIRAKENWGRVKTIGGIAWALNVMFDTVSSHNDATSAKTGRTATTGSERRRLAR